MGIPLLWRNIWGRFLKVFSLSLFSFIGALFILRFREIASMASFGASWMVVFSFALYQIPYILPYVIPLSSFISATLLFQSLSHTRELVVLRTTGLSLWRILLPLVFLSFYLGLGNLLIASELTTYSRAKQSQIADKATKKNLFYLIKNPSFMGLNGWVTEGELLSAQHLNDVLLFMPDQHAPRFRLLQADSLKEEGEMISGERTTLLTTTASKEGKPHLAVETIDSLTLPAHRLDHFFDLSSPRIKENFFSWRMLLASMQPQQQGQAFSSIATKTMVYNEFLRRLTLALAVVIFTLMGAIFGIDSTRQQQNHSFFIALGCLFLFWTAFFTAKTCRSSLLCGSLCYLTPLLIGGLLSLQRLFRLERGKTH